MVIRLRKDAFPLLIQLGLEGAFRDLQRDVGNGKRSIEKEGPVPVVLDNPERLVGDVVVAGDLPVDGTAGAGKRRGSRLRFVSFQRHAIAVMHEQFRPVEVGAPLVEVAEKLVDALPGGRPSEPIGPSPHLPNAPVR